MNVLQMQYDMSETLRNCYALHMMWGKLIYRNGYRNLYMQSLGLGVAFAYC